MLYVTLSYLIVTTDHGVGIVPFPALQTHPAKVSECLLGTRGSEAGLYSMYFFFYLAEPQNSSNRSLSQVHRRMPRVI